MTDARAAEVRHDIVTAIRVVRSTVAAVDHPTTPEELEVALYTKWFSLSGQRLRRAPMFVEPPRLVARLRAAHTATARFESGWRADAVGASGEIVARRGDDELVLMPPDYVNVARPATPVGVGDAIEVTMRRDMVDHELGWWMTDGRCGPAAAAPMARLYWNVLPERVPDLVAGLTDVLERAQVPYSLKCPSEFALFGRVDALVVYLTPSAYGDCKVDLRRCHEQLADTLDSPTPPFTLRLAPGVAAAEDPADGQSYGQSRCAAVADLLLRALRSGRDDEAELVSSVLDGLEEHGISPTHPFLGADSPTDLLTPW